MITRLAHEWHYFSLRWRRNVQNQMALRMNFILQMIAMMINNIAFFTIWYFFNKTVGTINGWGTIQTFGLLSYVILIFGLSDMLFGSQHHMGDSVPTGRFDIFLVKPKNLYIRILSDDFSPTSVGDVIQSLIAFGIFFYIQPVTTIDVVTMLVMLVPAITTVISFIMVCSCIVFWLPQLPLLSQTLKDMFYLPCMQPLGLVRGKLRVFYLFVVPCLTVGALPIQTITFNRPELIAIAYGIAGLWLLISVWILKISVRHYESGNVIG